MLQTHSDVYSVAADLNDDPTIKVIDLCIDLCRRRYHVRGICDGLFFVDSLQEGGLVLNPLLRKSKWIPEDVICGRNMGYDGSRPEKSYKIIGSRSSYYTTNCDRVAVLEFATNEWKVTDRTRSSEKLLPDLCRVSLNGNLYWTGYKYPHTGEYFIGMLDFSNEIEQIFCKLPCEREKAGSHIRFLSIYKGDRFSVLQQSRSTGETKIWVTEKKIGNRDDGGNVVWIKFMTVSRPDFPMVFSHSSTSYFVDNNIYGKSLVLCCRSKKPIEGWVYIVRGDLCKKIKIDEVVCDFQSSVYVPSLINIS